MTLSIEPLTPDDATKGAELRVAVVASATFHRDVLAFVLGKDSVLEVGPSVVSLAELDEAGGDADLAVVVLPGDTGLAVLARSEVRSWSEQFRCPEPMVIVGWDTPPGELRRFLKLTSFRPSSHLTGIPSLEAAPDSTDRQPEAALRQLTEREFEVLVALTQGRSAVDTATAFGISPNTVRTHVTNLLRKLGAHSRLEAMAMTRDHLTAERRRRDGLVSDDIS
jgi:DNA-binding CsgD family transcriptional regulator